ASAYQRMHWAESGMSMRELSRIGLPMSRVSSRASSSLWESIRSAKRIRTFLRSEGAILAQVPFSKAARAAATARSTSSLSPAATWLMTLPVAGLRFSKVLPEAAGTYLPLMKAWPRKARPAACALRSSRDNGADIRSSWDERENEGRDSSHPPGPRQAGRPTLPPWFARLDPRYRLEL